MQRWDESLWLFTPEEILSIPGGTVLKSINGDLRTKGKDYLDDDTRFGLTAYGMTYEMAVEQNLHHDLLVMMLKQ